MDLRIDRLANRVLTASEEDAEAWRARVDACSRTGLTRALGEVLPDVLAAAGLGPEAEVVIARVRARVVVGGEGFSDLELSRSWAQAVAAELRAIIEPLARAGGGATSEVAVFADRFAAERQSVLEQAAGLPAPWWWAAVSGQTDGGVAAVFRRWMNDLPERAPAAVAEIARASRRGLSGVLSEAEGRALLNGLLRTRTERIQSLGSPKTGAGADLSKAIVASHEAAQSTSGAAVPERAKAHRRVLLLPDEARVVGSGPGADVQRFVAACLVLARSPAADISADTAFEVQSPGKEPSDGAREDVSRDLRRSTTEEASLAGASKKPEPGSDPSRRDEAPRPRDSQAPTPPTREAAVRVEGPARPSNEAESHRVEAGGLLFLVRWIARSAWLDEHRSEALSQRLAAFGAIAVDRVLSPLPPASKQNVFYRQWPLVQVFSALRGEPPPGAFSGAETVLAEIGITDGEVLSDAARLVDEVASEIPPDLALFEGGVRAVFGARERPFAASDPTERLAALMLRPGRLSVSAHRAELTLPARSVDVALRIGGWDIDPGFVPYLGRVIRFVYEEPLP